MMIWQIKLLILMGVYLFNDSTFGVSPNIRFLKNYLKKIYPDKKLKIPTNYILDQSDFLTLKNKNIYCICDVGSIKPDYQPGRSC